MCKHMNCADFSMNYRLYRLDGFENRRLRRLRGFNFRCASTWIGADFSMNYRLDRLDGFSMNYRLDRLDGFLWGKIINAQAHELAQIGLAQEDGFH